MNFREKLRGNVTYCESKSLEMGVYIRGLRVLNQFLMHGSALQNNKCFNRIIRAEVVFAT